jgi:drug/metabolite transporter (DMT)-like permease
MLAFAANSLLCRMAIERYAMDPMEFTLLRICSGALFLLLFSLLKSREFKPIPFRLTVIPAVFLASYAFFFALAYTKLETGTGALMLFGAVQLAMLCWVILKRNYPNAMEWLGWAFALAGFLYLLLPFWEGPAMDATLYMMLSGISWGAYSVWGQLRKNDLASTRNNFVLASVFLLPLLFFEISFAQMQAAAIWSAVLSGVVFSAGGYLLWYYVLPRIKTMMAASAQLSVPLIAALAGWIWLTEAFTIAWIISAVLILGGIFLNQWGASIKAK